MEVAIFVSFLSAKQRKCYPYIWNSNPTAGSHKRNNSMFGRDDQEHY